MSHKIRLCMITLLSLGFVVQLCLSSALPDGPEEVKWLKKDDFEDHKDASDDVDRDEPCELCQENFQVFKEHRLVCGHYFHEHCIRSWVLELEDDRRGCPICSVPVKFKETNHDIRKFLFDQNHELAEVLRELWGVMVATDSMKTIPEWEIPYE